MTEAAVGAILVSFQSIQNPVKAGENSPILIQEVIFMRKNKILSLIRRFASPVALALLGLILLLFPDSASVLVAKVLGWGVFLVGVGFAIAAIASPGGTAGKVLAALACLAVGTWLVRNPLVLAKGVGRFIGILLLIRGAQDFFQSGQSKGRLLSLIVAVLGVVLIVLPMTTSRLVFSACGLVVLLLGIAMFLDRFRSRGLPGSDDDPNIIDAL